MEQRTEGLLLELPTEDKAKMLIGKKISVDGLEFTFDEVVYSGDKWLKATINSQEDINPWQAAHILSRNSVQTLNLSQEPYVEPNWVQLVEGGLNVQKLIGAERCHSEDPDEDWLPTKQQYQFGWHLGDGFSQLGDARIMVSPDLQQAIRIAHLDTGVDTAHKTCPENLCLQDGYNFVENNTNSIDPVKRGPHRNPGHGTGTLGILAGRKVQPLGNHFNDYLGGCPYATVIPIRVANSVVHLLEITLDALAKGIHHAIEKNCDVLTLSMGGLPSKNLLAAVNAAYDAGVAMFAAAGNCKLDFPKSVVWPARFGRVTAVAGVTYGYQPYKNSNLMEMEGVYGPEEVMKHAISAFTPNMPWAQIGCPDIIDRDGAGTSSATPQAAAAAALWLAINGHRYPKGWQRVEAVRKALFDSAKHDFPGYSLLKFGNGVLQARRALDILPDISTLTKTPEDTMPGNALALLMQGMLTTDLGALSPAEQEMLRMELLQTNFKREKIQESALNQLALAMASGDASSVEDIQQEISSQLLEEPDISDALRNALQGKI